MTTPDPSSFSGLPLDAALLQNLETLGYLQMTPVQAQALPPVLAGRDVIAQAQTGSGKTAVFGLGLLTRLDPALVRVQALVLCPTRELADQVSREIRRLARAIPNIKLLTLCGGSPLRVQLASLQQHEPHIVVGTPGRIEELLRVESLRPDRLRTLVLDEADRMLDMGFEESIQAIIERLPDARQTLLFSATYPEQIRAVSRRIQQDPIAVTVTPSDAVGATEQVFYEVTAETRFEVLARLLAERQPEPAVVFCNTRLEVQAVTERLRALGFAALALQGDLEQRDRDEVLLRFANRSCSVLVATDVAARGLDIHDLPVVINHELARDPDVHLHRVGRTGRAGRKGLACSLVLPGERQRVATIGARQGIPVRWERLAPAGTALPRPAPAPMVTLVIDGGRKDKLRPGDILGALTGTAGLAASAVGKIDIFPVRAYVAVERALGGEALARLRSGRIKNRTFRVRSLDS